MKWISNAKRNQPKESGSIFRCEQYPYISIHKLINCGDSFYFDCAELVLYNVPLGTEDFEEAISKAQNVVRSRIKEFMNRYGDFYIDQTETEII